MVTHFQYSFSREKMDSVRFARPVDLSGPMVASNRRYLVPANVAWPVSLSETVGADIPNQYFWAEFILM